MPTAAGRRKLPPPDRGSWSTTDAFQNTTQQATKKPEALETWPKHLRLPLCYTLCPK